MGTKAIYSSDPNLALGTCNPNASYSPNPKHESGMTLLIFLLILLISLHITLLIPLTTEQVLAELHLGHIEGDLAEQTTYDAYLEASPYDTYLEASPCDAYLEASPCPNKPIHAAHLEGCRLLLIRTCPNGACADPYMP